MSDPAGPRPSQVLVVNAGSSTLKLSLLGPDDEILSALDLDPWDGRPDHGELSQFLGGLSRVDAVGHRVGHGGSRFTRATVTASTTRSPRRSPT
jgi:acetate kinase